jgi:hypothetical protein
MLSGPEHEAIHETHRPNRRRQSILPLIFIYFGLAKWGESIDKLLDNEV